MAIFTIRKGREGQMSGVDPRLMAILRQAAANAPPGVSRVEAFSGKAGRSTGTKNHPGGRAVDLSLYDANGVEIENFVGGKISKGEEAAYQINEQFAQTVRAVQQDMYPDLGDRLRWGGYFVSGTPGDLMHFDLSGGLSSKTPPQTAAWQSGIGRGGSVGVAALTQPVNVAAAPQDAQSAIASLVAPGGGTQVPDAPTPLMGYAPDLPGGMPPAPPMPTVQTAAAIPPEPMPEWVNGGFPDMTGAAGPETMLGGIAPPMPGTGQRTGILPPIPGMRPGGAPSPDMLGMPRMRPPGLSPIRPAMPNATDQSAGLLPPIPQLRPGGAPDASMVPMPPPRASGLPTPPPRPAGGPSPYPAEAMANMPGMVGPLGLQSLVAGREESPAGGMPAGPSPWDDWTRAFDIPPPISRMADNPPPVRQSTQYPSLVEGREEFPGALPASSRQGMTSADPSLMLPPSWSPAMSFPPPPGPPPQNGTVEAGSTGGEWFTPAPPMPGPMADANAERFDLFNMPSGQIMDLQTAFQNKTAPPSPISPPLGTQPAYANDQWMNGGGGTNNDTLAQQLGINNIATAAMPSPTSYTPFVGPIDAWSAAENAKSFGAGSVVNPPQPQAGVTPGVSLPMAEPPIDPTKPYTGPVMPTPPEPPQQNRDPAATQKQGLPTWAKVLASVFGGPVGGIGAGLIGGGGGGFNIGGQPSFAWTGGGSTPGGVNWKSGTTNALGPGKNSQVGPTNALSWTGSKGQPVTVVQDPWTGTYYGPSGSF